MAYFATYVLPLSHSAPSLPLEFRAVVNRQETWVMELSSSEDRMIVAGVVLAWYQRVTDGRSDGQTETIIADTALCITISKLCWGAVKMIGYDNTSRKFNWPQLNRTTIHIDTNLLNYEHVKQTEAFNVGKYIRNYV